MMYPREIDCLADSCIIVKIYYFLYLEETARNINNEDMKIHGRIAKTSKAIGMLI